MKSPINEQMVFRLLSYLPDHSFLKRYVQLGMAVSDCSAIYHLANGLVLLSMAVPKGYSFDFGQPMPANLLALIVGDSSTARKSTSIKLARRMMAKAMPDRIGNNPGSYEGLTESVMGKPQQCIFFDEFGDFLAKTQEGYASAMKTAFNNLYDCAPVGRHLAKTGKKEVMVDPFVSVTAGVTPVYLNAHTTNEDFTGGFLARFFTVFADRERFYAQPPGNNDLFEQLCSELRSMTEIQTVGVGVGFTQDAMPVWHNWANYLESIPRQVPSEVAGAIYRANAMSLRIASLLAFDFGYGRSGQNWLIGYRELSVAIAIVKLHVSSVIAIATTLANTHDMRDRQRVLDCLDELNPVSLGDITYKSKLLHQRVLQILSSTMQEGVVAQVGGSFGIQYVLKRRSDDPEMKLRAAAEQFSF